MREERRPWPLLQTRACGEGAGGRGGAGSVVGEGEEKGACAGGGEEEDVAMNHVEALRETEGSGL